MPDFECKNIIVANFFTKQKYSRKINTDIWLEEEVVWKNLSVKKINFSFLEAGMRGRKRLSQILQCNMKELNTIEYVMISRIQKELEQLVQRYAVDRVMVPAGIGGHIDHIIVREAALNFVKSENCKLYFESPYLINRAWLTKGIDEIEQRYNCSIHKVNVTDVISMKEEKLALYKSQFSEREIKKMLQASFNPEKNIFEEYIVTLHNKVEMS